MSMVPVSRDTHAGKRLRPLTSYAYAAATPVVRVVMGEIAQVAAAYPIVFIEEGGVRVPFAMLGLGQGQNLFVGEDGKWLGMYIPALLRRFPFALGTASNGSGTGEVTLLVDDAYLSDSEGAPLFEASTGEPDGKVGAALQFLGGIELQAQQTTAISKTLSDFDLLDPLPLEVAQAGQAPTTLGGIFTVSDAKLNALPDEAFLQLRRSGALALAHAQLLSLAQFARLQAMSTAQ